MKWYEYTTSLYPCAAINNGVKRTIKDVLHTDFANTHKYKVYHNDQVIEGIASDIGTIIEIRTEQVSKVEKLLMKGSLQCWQPSCYMPEKSKGSKPETLNPILCLDFDNLHEFDIEELKLAIFALSFVCFVSRSCSGTGIYALILIEEPERLKEYAEHFFKVFQKLGIPIDTGKGQNPTQLRFVSYDANMLWKEYPVPFKLAPYKAPAIPVNTNTQTKDFTSTTGLIKWGVDKIHAAQMGERFETVRKVAFALGGHGVGLEEIENAIHTGTQFAGVKSKYLKTAVDAFKAGQLKPIAA